MEYPLLYLLVVLCAVIILLLGLLFRAHILRRLSLVIARQDSMENDIAAIQYNLDEKGRTLLSTIKFAVSQAIQPITESMKAQDDAINEMKDMLVQLVNNDKNQVR